MIQKFFLEFVWYSVDFPLLHASLMVVLYIMMVLTLSSLWNKNVFNASNHFWFSHFIWYKLFSTGTHKYIILPIIFSIKTTFHLFLWLCYILTWIKVYVNYVTLPCNSMNVLFFIFLKECPKIKLLKFKALQNNREVPYSD